MTTASDEDMLREAQAKLQYWENYVHDRQRERQAAAGRMQALMDESGLSARGVNPLAPEFAEIAHDLEFQRQLSLHHGLKLDEALPVDTSKPDVSRWRQRTRAMKV